MLTIRLNFKVFTDLSIKMDEFSFSSVFTFISDFRYKVIKCSAKVIFIKWMLRVEMNKDHVQVNMKLLKNFWL